MTTEAFCNGGMIQDGAQFKDIAVCGAFYSVIIIIFSLSSINQSFSIMPFTQNHKSKGFAQILGRLPYVAGVICMPWDWRWVSVTSLGVGVPPLACGQKQDFGLDNLQVLMVGKGRITQVCSFSVNFTDKRQQCSQESPVTSQVSPILSSQSLDASQDFTRFVTAPEPQRVLQGPSGSPPSSAQSRGQCSYLSWLLVGRSWVLAQPGLHGLCPHCLLLLAGLSTGWVGKGGPTPAWELLWSFCPSVCCLASLPIISCPWNSDGIQRN